MKDAILHLSEFQINAVTRTVMAGKLVEYLATARIGERGTLTLPKDYRDALNLQTGAALTMLRIGNGLMLIPEQKRFDELCDRIATELEHAGVSEAALQATLPEVRERVARRRYPALFSKKRRKAGSKKR
jgi:bifunctional DNA-binding transcriptional regulator/antitoxin component of YhaV-PrlF toxin-antitoxin module